MSAHHTLATHLAAQPAAADAYALTSGRLLGAVAALVALAGVVVGGLALARATGPHRKHGAGAALVAGLVGVAVGGFVVAVAEGGPGTGQGIVGGFVALAIGAVAVILGGLGLARGRRTTSGQRAG